MAGGLIGALRVSLSADTAAFSAGMSKAKREASQSSAAIQKSLGGVKTAMAGLVAGLTLGALTAVAKRALDYASSLGEVAQQLGVTTKQLQVFRYAASQVGISNEEMDKALGKLNITLGQAASGAKAPKDAFDALSKIIGKDIVASSKQGGDALPLVADGLAKITDRSKRAAIEVALFGRTGAKLDTFLAGGSKAINELADAAEKMGLVLSDEQIQKADETADKLAAMKQVLEARIAGVVSDNADSIYKLADALAKAAAGVVKFLGSDPGRAATLMSTLGGAWLGARFGPVGAAVGAGAGFLAGRELGPRSEKELQTSIAKLRREANLVARAQGFKGDGSERDRKIAASPGVALRVKKMRAAEAQLAAMRAPTLAITREEPAAAGVDPGDFLSGGGGKPKKDNSAAEAERKRKELLRDSYAAAEDERDAILTELRARQDLVSDIHDRGVLEEQMLEKEHEGALAQIDFNLAMGDINQAQADKQRALEETIHGLKLEKLKQDEAYDIQQERIKQQRAIADSAIEVKEMEASLAQTAAERRKIELKILAAKFAQLRQAQQEIVDDASSSPEEKNAAGRRLIDLDKLQTGATTQVMRGTMGPLESFLDSLPNTAAKANEALEMIAANGLQSLVDGLIDAITGARSLGDVFSSIARQIIADLIRIQIQKAISGGLSSALGSIGSIFGGATAAAGASGGGGSFSRPKFATGGSFTVLGNKGVDTNLLSLNGVPIANVSHGEKVSVATANDNQRGGKFYFDLRGAVVTQDLLNQMNAIGDGAAVRGALAGASMSEQRIARRSRRRLA